jgi:hypothetical protein
MVAPARHGDAGVVEMVVVSAFVLLFLALRKISGSSLAGYLAALAAIVVGAPFFDVRPQLYSLLGFAVLLRLALLPSRYRWLLPVGFFWVNLHGGSFPSRVCAATSPRDLPIPDFPSGLPAFPAS